MRRITKRRKNRKSGKQNSFKKLKCSPSKTDRTSFSCYSSNDLIKIRDAWNKRHPDRLINSEDDHEIWNIIKIYSINSCKNERCWLSSLFKKNELDDSLLLYTFSPTRPDKWKDNPNTWLSSLDIEAVMNQYERKYDDFAFIGCSPIDFDKVLHNGECVWPELCNFNINEYIDNNVNKIGISLNLDEHTKGGSHWVSLFIDLKNKYIFYFDSNGDETPKEVKRLIDRINNQCLKLSIEMKIYESNIEHQKKNTECGIYSLYFLTYLLKNNNYNHFLDKRISDEEMFKLRNKFFN
tara:strand:- start:742 stop:1623 length:882 start_codon:yes stop_codon:yes gene_type:complete